MVDSFDVVDADQRLRSLEASCLLSLSLIAELIEARVVMIELFLDFAFRHDELGHCFSLVGKCFRLQNECQKLCCLSRYNCLHLISREVL